MDPIAEALRKLDDTLLRCRASLCAHAARESFIRLGRRCSESEADAISDAYHSVRTEIEIGCNPTSLEVRLKQKISDIFRNMTRGHHVKIGNFDFDRLEAKAPSESVICTMVDLKRLLKSLSSAEREILNQVLLGFSNEQSPIQIPNNESTFRVRRHRLLQKLLKKMKDDDVR